VEVVRRKPGAEGFVVQAGQWAIERSIAWLVGCRRLVRDDGPPTEPAKAWIYLAMVRLTLHHPAALAHP